MSKIKEEKILSYQQVREYIELNNPSWACLDFSRIRLSDRELQDLTLLLEKKNTQVGRIIWSSKQTFPKGLEEIIDERLTFNTNNFKAWPDDYQMSLLSLHVYNPVVQGKVKGVFVKQPGLNMTEEFIPLNGWVAHEIFDDEASGYYGVLYHHLERQHWVLAHRGADVNLNSVKGIKETSKDFQANIKGVIGGKIVAQQVQGYLATQKATAEVTRQGGRLSTTGHSLGGWLAQLTSTYVKNQIVHAVVFDAPSAGEMIAKLHSSLKMSLEQLRNKLDITLYLSAPNPSVNVCIM